MSTLIIAEAGVNHNGDPAMARQLVEIAAGAGADLVKFQTFTADRLVTARAPKAEYQTRLTQPEESQHSMLRRLEMTRDMHVELAAHCRTCSIGFLSTAFDEQSLDLVVELGVDTLKVPSGEITNLPFLRHVGGYRMPVILSTGMATLEEVEQALDALVQAGAPQASITVLHCSTAYPTQMADVNLRAMLTLRDAFGMPVGYSDHTAGIEVAVAAVALGAAVIEKHFTLDRALPGPDHQASLEPRELTAMIAAIRNIELALGDGIKRPTPAEAANKMHVRKSLVASTAIRAGELFTRDNVTTKRPGTGLSPMRWDDVLGRPAPRAFAVDEPIVL